MIKEKNKILVIAGPTAVGKTDFAIEIAKLFKGEIVSCDSMQLYKYMDIGSAKPSQEQLKEVPHYLIGEINPLEDFSVAKYSILGIAAIDNILSRKKLPIIAGGTGLYLNSLLYEMDFSLKPEDGSFNEFRESLFKEAEEKGNYFIYKKLLALDAQRGKDIHPNNIKKVVRAIEAATLGEGIKPFNNIKEYRKEYDPIMVCLTRDREELYDRINKRTDLLMEAGLLDEIKNLLKLGLTSESISMKGIGYKELIGYLEGDYSLDEAISLIKRNSRRLAKRQITWFKRYEDMKWCNLSRYSSDELAMEEICSWLRKQLKSTTKVISPKI